MTTPPTYASHQPNPIPEAVTGLLRGKLYDENGNVLTLTTVTTLTLTLTRDDELGGEGTIVGDWTRRT